MTPRVDFYRLPATGTEASLHAACLVTGKAYNAGYRVRVYADPDRITDLDQRLWTFRQGSFVPHARRERLDPDFPEPVVLASDCDDPEGADVLICAAPPPADCLPHYARVAEFVTQDDTVKEAARRRYTAYRQAGYELHAHDLRLN